jgi:hypothetical protein
LDVVLRYALDSFRSSADQLTARWTPWAVGRDSCDLLECKLRAQGSIERRPIGPGARSASETWRFATLRLGG